MRPRGVVQTWNLDFKNPNGPAARAQNPEAVTGEIDGREKQILALLNEEERK